MVRLPCQNLVSIRSSPSEILKFYYFASLAGKCLTTPPLGGGVVEGFFNQLNTLFLENEHGLVQMVHSPTHCGHIIDKVFVSRPDLYTCIFIIIISTLTCSLTLYCMCVCHI